MLKYIVPGLLAYLKMALYQISYLILISRSLTLIAQRLTLLLLYNVLLLLILYLSSLVVIYQIVNLITIYQILQFLIQCLTLINQSFQITRFNTNKTYKQAQRFLLCNRYLSLSNQLVLLYAAPFLLYFLIVKLILICYKAIRLPQLRTLSICLSIRTVGLAATSYFTTICLIGL